MFLEVTLLVTGERLVTNIKYGSDSLRQWWANYGPRARCGPLRGSIRPAADFKI